MKNELEFSKWVYAQWPWLDHSGSTILSKAAPTNMDGRLSAVAWRTMNGPLTVTVGFYLTRFRLDEELQIFKKTHLSD